jgi:hypothetical protein
MDRDSEHETRLWAYDTSLVMIALMALSCSSWPQPMQRS